ncbi:MAG: serine threonine kinase Kin1 [Lasallia pustulata]|uniref:non-specific serine/threonine protein kinase n=1 Tax=Lasallia pustulata TaxID=136370 RepID=A0A5M8PNT9_9LECA|nr:MAG: serine threonine kinase Kin1 [Lasallia pustulata]
MSAASTASPAIVRSSSSRRSQAYTAPASDRPLRPQSTAIKSTAQSYSHTRGPSASQQASLAGVARRDYENTNLARPPSSRRSSSRDGSYAAPPPTTRTESTRSTHRNSSRPGHSRYSSDMSQTPTVVANGGSTLGRASSVSRAQNDGAVQASSSGTKRRTTITAATGDWTLGKTIGQGSMGKVKLAKNLETGEQVAVKIVPRQSTDEHQSNRDRERADHSKEIRTAREAAIVTLLDHPYICAMRDVVRTDYHWYMLFEFVNGGQMLDYIISHGRLKEKQARKFGRQIASALDYCHRNSIVHRDLKIENILISKTGDIKIIDFGLSNLFSPRSSLKTFCGSLYFAAPELLQAKQYTGPEVDIWSFGIVLYVLVCGKVPFDDQNMPQLHAKIKKGVVDYPAWLSADCKNLISRMLVTDPKQRSNLGEIMNHPWITKGFNAPPENYLPHREPVQLPLDPVIVNKMTGFDFGPSEYITRELTKVIESEEYQSAVRLNAREYSAQSHVGEKKRGVFDFYKRRNSTSRDTLSNLSSEAVPLGSDPVNAFSPLLSIYYLAREKRERERREENPGAFSMPMSPGEKALKMPDLPAPEAAYTNSATYEMPGEKATGGRSRPRARTHGEDEVTKGMKKVNLSVSKSQAPPAIVTPPIEPSSVRKENTAVGLLRRFSTRRNKESTRERNDSQRPPSLQIQPPNDMPPPARTSFSVRRSRHKDRSPPESPMLHRGGSQPHQNELLTPPFPAEAGSRASKLLNRSTSVNSAEYRRRQSRRAVSEGVATGVSGDPTSGSDQSSVTGLKSRGIEAVQTEQNTSLNPRAATLRTKSLGHARRESIQARRARREEVREANVPEETDQQLAAGEGMNDKTESADNIKPVYLKGLFSVSTTSNKPLSYIRNDIIRVLNQLGVDYTEIKGGFSCRHAPSIDLNRVGDNGPSSAEQQGGMGYSTHRPRISFGGFRGGDRVSEDFRDHDRSPKMARSGSRRHAADTSFTNSEGSEESVGHRNSDRPAPGETTTHVQSELGGSMVLKFEIFIVKVPLFSLHGIQFKKVAGGAFQYKDMAQKILDALRL